jgi:hypothetical protein
MADNIILRVLGEERQHLEVLRQSAAFLGQDDSKIIRALLRREAEALQKPQQPPLNQIAYHTRAIQRILDGEAERQDWAEEAAEIDEIRRDVYVSHLIIPEDANGEGNSTHPGQGIDCR